MTRNRTVELIGALGVGLGILLARSANGQIAVRNQGFVPFSDAPIFYRGDVDDPVARLQKQLDRGRVTLTHDPDHGYLRAVLDALKVPIASQTLVLSKT
ncbi:MAG TPA: hypothetical protein VLV86_13690, partial [Vicinamibacterales bacterium]|nr:hypothetical protein [Vicinamibacterales bacterium]